MKANGFEGKKCVALLFIVLMLSSAPYAKEVKNTLSAVKNAKQGDYITLVGGRRYVLVDAEIEAAKGELDYDDAALKQNEVPRSDEGVEYNITFQRCYQRKDGDLAADVSGDEVMIGSKAHLAEHQNETVPKTNDFDEIMNILNFGDEVSEFVCIYAKRIEELTLLDCADKDISTAAKKAYQGLLREVSTWSRDSEAITRKTIDYHVDIKLYMVSCIDSLRYKATNMACYFIMATGPAFLKYKDNKGNKNDDSASFLNNCTSAISHHRFEYDKDAIKELASDPLYRKALMAFKQ